LRAIRSTSNGKENMIYAKIGKKQVRRDCPFAELENNGRKK
jgi:hypothetical protein